VTDRRDTDVCITEYGAVGGMWRGTVGGGTSGVEKRGGDDVSNCTPKKSKPLVILPM